MSINAPRARALSLVALVLTLAAVLGSFASPAQAAFTANLTQAKPVDLSASANSNFDLKMTFPGDSTVKALAMDFPKGQLGAVANATACPIATWKADNCAASSVVGFVTTSVSAQAAILLGIPITLTASGNIYRLPESGTEAARIGMSVASSLSATMYIEGTIRLRNDYGITATVPAIPNVAQVQMGFLGLGNADITIKSMDVTMYGRINNGGATAKGFFFNPAECLLANTSIVATPWSGTALTRTAGYTPTNCASVPFNPSVAFSAAPSPASSPAQFTVKVSQPYNATDAKVAAPFRATSLVMPEGIQLSGAADSDGLLVDCTDAQFAYGTTVPTTCPAKSAVGTVAMDSPLVGVVPGTVFLAKPLTGVGHENEIIRLFMVAELGTATDAVRVKLQAKVDVNPTTGRMEVSLIDLPAQPVKSFTFQFRAATAPATRQPRLCGTYGGNASLTGFATTTAVTRNADYLVDTNCAATDRFRPTIAMTTTPNRAGAATTGVTTIKLPVGDQPITKLTASLPAGLLANVTGITRCTRPQVAAGSCPAASKVGTVAALAGQSSVPGAYTGDVFLSDPDPTDTAALVGLFFKVPVNVGPIFLQDLTLDASVKLRTDYGLDVTSPVPEELRRIKLDLQQLDISFDKANFMTNPVVCAGNTIGGTFKSSLGTDATNSSAMTVTGCSTMAFAPSLAFSASPPSAGGGSSLTTTITLPASVPGAEQSPPKEISLTLPDDVSLSPSANSGATNLDGCTDAQFDQTTFADPTCPAASAVGTVAIQTPSIGRLSGTAYLAKTAPGHLARVLLDAKSDDFGAKARVKLEGTLDVNATNGRVTAVFDNIPNVSFTSFALTLRGGTNPVLSMPRTCGTTSGSSTMTPHGGAVASPTGSLAITTNCADATSFAPTFTNVITPTVAGGNTTMTTTIGLPERHRQLDKLTMRLPAGLLANVATAPRCTIAQANAGTCAAATKIGDVSTLAGQGTTPSSFPGSLYLTDPPTANDVVGIAVQIPAVVGPVDLGNVLTIASVRLRPSDYGIDVVADVPTQIKGIPLYLRQLKLLINKSGFLTNPVTCAATTTAATLHSEGGSSVDRSDAFQATGCGALGFSPTLTFSASPAQAAGASAFTTKIALPATGQGALKKAVVDLPTGVALSSSINSAGTLVGCTAAQFDQATFANPTCPASSAIGTASIDVPQVGPLTGNVYLADTAPSGAIAGLYLDAKSATFGASVRVKLTGKVDVDAATGKTTATFDNAPAVAFTTFQLDLRGGTAPALSMPRTCGTPSGAAALTPQSGTTVSRTGSLTVAGDCTAADKFEATGSVALSDARAGQDTNLTTTINVPSGQRELSKVAISLPAGLLAKIDGLPRCSVASATAGTCAAATKIGTITAAAGQGTSPGTFSGDAFIVDAPTSADIIAIGLSLDVKVGPIDLGKVNVIAPVQLRSDYGIDITADVPTRVKGIPIYLRQLKIAITKSGFLFNPSTCGLKTTTLTVGSASYAGAKSDQTLTSDQTITDCDQIGFAPQVAFSATPAKAGGSGAFTTRITLPSTPAQSALKAASVRLPDGLSLSPSIDSNATLTGCTAAQFDQSIPSNDPTCPAAAEIGTTSVQTTSVGALTGKVFLAATTPSGLARVFVYASSGNFPGARVKMSGIVDVNAATGETTAVFSDAPEVPFTEFVISFRGGDQPTLSLPRTCGTPQGSATLTSHAGGAAVDKTATLTIDQNCTEAAKFEPSIATTSSPATAAAKTTFSTKITVPAGQQELSRVQLSLPTGLIAQVDGHARCSISDANAGTCAAAAKIGTITAKAGQGNVPATYTGTVYLTDNPAAGDLVGLAIELAVKVGKNADNSAIIDLGKITVVGGLSLRQDYGVDVDISVPTAVKGIPMIVRELTLALNDDFMINPATCSSNAVSGTLTSKQNTAKVVSSTLAISGCATAGFDPSVAFSANPATPAKAASLRTELLVPADQLPIKQAVVGLPTGVSLTASADANGDLAGCTDAQFAVTSWNDPACAAGSKVGSVTIDTPSIGAITGDAYLAETAPAGAIARLFIDAKSANPDFGAKARIKITGVVTVDPATGKTTATFDDLPAVSFTRFALDLRGGSNPVVSLPRTAGSFAGSAVLSTHEGRSVSKSGSLVLTGGPAAGQFGPQVAFDLNPNLAGGAGKLTTTITVPGGDQELKALKMTMPEGLTAKLKGADLCAIVQAQADACPANTKLGTVTAKVGVDGAPFSQAGDLYLTAGRNGNVAGIAIVLPAKVGPIDLGKVITIADIQLHSPDLALEITADVPTQVKGVRLDIRELKLAITKDDFLVNPSSCGTLPGTAAFEGKDGANATATASVTVAATSCADQTFDPQLSFSAGNPKPGEASDFTTTVALAAGAGPASPFKAISIRLPDGMSLSASADANGKSAPALAGCTTAQFHQDDLTLASACPAGSEIGTAKFETDLVGDLLGKVYLAPATSGNLARVFLETKATDVDNLTVRIVGEVQVNETTGITTAVFASVPAIPVTKFTVTFRGGDAPTLALPRLCGDAVGRGVFTPVNSSTGVQTKNATLALATDCPDPAAFTPTIDLGRSTAAAGRSMTFTTTLNVPAKQQELDSLKMSLPAGLLGKISSIPACAKAAADAGTCTPSSKVGTVTAQVGVASAPFTVNGAAYLVKGDDTVIARLAIVLPAKVGPIDLGNVTTYADLKLRADYGLDITAAQIPTKVKGVRLDLHQLVLAIDKADFMVNPIVCGSTDAASRLGSAQGGQLLHQQAFITTDCDQLKLDASLGFTAAPASPLVASAVTTKIRASAPGGDPLDAMKNVTVLMPESLSLSASAGARGDLAECSAGAFRAAEIDVDAACPAGSKIGTVAITSPMVGDLTGDAYLGVKTGGHFAGIFLQAKAAEYPALRVKLAGTLDVDETTGRMTAVFSNLPQVQVSALDLTLRGGDAPVLSLPRTCGNFGAALTVQRHGGAATSASGALTLDQDCPDAGAFAPTVQLSPSTTQAGADTALNTVISVPARHQELTSVDLALPVGLLGRLTVAPKCAVDAAQANACGDASVVGSVIAKVGAASAPYTVTGKVFLTDGFDGSIAGLMFALPAKVGPIDLGTVVTLAKVQITGNDLQLRITAAGIPTRVKGIPLSISELGINIDKPGMVLNASTCGDKQAVGTFGSLQGGSAQATTGYRATGCDALNWKPAFSLTFTGAAADVKKLGHPTITTVIDQTDANGNLRAADVLLPTGVAVDLKNVNARVCASAAKVSAGECGDSAKIGTARIITSALPQPVGADIYMVTIPGQTLPGIAIRVRDQINFDLVGTTKLDKTGRVRVTFDGMPDTPISRMTLVFNGGATGVIQLGAEICGIAGIQTDATLTAQHGAAKTFQAPINCNGVVTPLTATTTQVTANSSVTFRPSGSGSAMTFALSNPNGISRLTLKMPKGAIFTKNAKKLVKPTLTGAKAVVRVTNGARTLTIRITPTVKGTKVTKVKFTLPKKAIKINIKIRKVLSDKKTSKKKKAKLLAKLLWPKVTMLDGYGKPNPVKITMKVSTKVSTKAK